MLPITDLSHLVMAQSTLDRDVIKLLAGYCILLPNPVLCVAPLQVLAVTAIT
jgi:hypothetical protein